MLELLRVMTITGGVVVITLMILLAMPASRLRDLVMPFVAWGFVALCAAYAISPIDFVPELFCGPAGVLDDFAVLAMGVTTAVKTINTAKKKNAAYHDPELN